MVVMMKEGWDYEWVGGCTKSVLLQRKVSSPQSGSTRSGEMGTKRPKQVNMHTVW